MVGTTALVRKNAPLRLSACWASQFSSVTSSMGSGVKMPALFTRMSTVPKASITSRARRSQSVTTPISARNAAALPPAASISATTASARSRLVLPTTATVAPSRP